MSMRETIHTYGDQLVACTQELIRIPSITGQEGDIAQFLINELHSIGVDEAFIDDIGNVVGVLHGKGGGPNIMLTGHLDVVPAGSIENWKGYDPFGGEIDDDGNIHGRGAADLKGGIAVQLFTMKIFAKLRDQGFKLPGNLIFSQVVHEEAAEMFGMEHLCLHTLPGKGIEFDVVLLCEPTGLKVVIGNRGKLELVVRTEGRTAHSSTPKAGINALQKMLPLMEKIFHEMDIGLPSDPLLGDASVTITNITCEPGMLSIIPDVCEISIDYRYVTGQSMETVLGDFKQIIEEIESKDPHFKAEVYVRTLTEKAWTGYQKQVQKHHPMWTIDKEHPVVTQVLHALQRVGQDPEISYWKFGTDGGMTAGRMGITTIGYSGAEEHYAHTPEEMISIDMMMQSLEGYVSIVNELYGIEIYE